MFFILFFLGAISVAAQQPINITLTNNANNTWICEAMWTTTMKWWKDSLQPYQEIIQAHGRSLYNNLIMSKNWMAEHKLKTAAITLLTFYSFINVRLLYLGHQLQKTSLWSSWGAGSLEELLAIPNQQLTTHLAHTIQQRYTTINNPADVIQPLITFMKDIEHELQLLQEYQRYCTLITKLHATRLSCINVTLLQSCEDRIKRLVYLKNIFLSWVADYKLGTAMG